MTPSPIRTGQTHLLADRFFDFSNGIVGNVSDAAAPIRHLRRANNVTFDRRRGLGIRRGFRDVTDYALQSEPHSLMKFYASATNRAFVADGAFVDSVIEASGYARQTLPITITSRWWHPVNINGVLVATQEGGANPPMAFNGTEWLSIVYPTPPVGTMTGIEAAYRAATAIQVPYGGGSVFGGYNFDIKAGWNDVYHYFVNSVRYDTAAMTPGSYNVTTFMAELKSKMDAGAHGKTFTWSYAANKLTGAVSSGTWKPETDGHYAQSAVPMTGFSMGFGWTEAASKTADYERRASRMWLSATGVNINYLWSHVDATFAAPGGWAAVDDTSSSQDTLADNNVAEPIVFSPSTNGIRVSISGTPSTVSVDPTGAGLYIAYSGGGSVDAGAHAYRIRWLFSNGASLVGPVFSATVPGGSNTVTISGVPVSTRSDYLGFQVERQKLGDLVTWYFVGVVLGGTSTYIDTASDASLGIIIPAQPGPYGQAPHFDNIFTYRGRLFGMEGGNLHPGQAVADVIPGVGCFNFNATQSFPISEIEDGDAGMLTVPQVDRMVVLKGKSLHALSGYDLDSFTMTPLARGMGAIGTRAACSNGPDVYFYDGDNRLFVLSGSAVKRIADPQVGHYLGEVTATVAAQSKVVLANYLGNRILMGYPANPSTYNNEVLALRLVDGRVEHYTNMRIADVLVQARRDDFAGASMLYADPLIQTGSSAQGFALNPSFALWIDNRVAQGQVFSQKLNSAGTPQLTANGVAVSAASSGTLSSKAIVSDGTGSGFLSAYAADQGGNSGFAAIYVQKTDSLGVNQFGSGVRLSSAFPYSFAQIVAGAVQDGDGGIVVAWYDTSGSTLRVGRVDSLGVVQWSTSVDTGVLAGPTGVITLLPDGSGGYFVVWNNSTAVRAQRLNALGVIQWAAGGVTVATSSTAAYGVARTSTGGLIVARWNTSTTVTAYVVNSSGGLTATSANLAPSITLRRGTPLVVADLEGGAIVAFAAQPSAGNDKLYAQRINGSAATLWSLVTVATYGSGIVGGTAISAIPDGSGGAIFTYQDLSPVVNYVQRLSPLGVASWGTGVALSASGASSTVIVTDGAGGVIATWVLSTNIYAQRVGSSGLIQWAAGGVVVCSATGSQSVPVAVFTNAPTGEVPPGSAPGYHIWSAFDGTSDARPRSATVTGDGIAWYAEFPASDAGEPDIFKAYEALQVHVKAGLTQMNASLKIDDGISTAIPVSVNVQGSRWGGTGRAVTNETLFWGAETGANPGQPHNWAGDSAGIVRSGIEAGLTGRKHALAISAETTNDLQVDGFVIDFRRLPDRTF